MSAREPIVTDDPANTSLQRLHHSSSNLIQSREDVIEQLARTGGQSEKNSFRLYPKANLVFLIMSSKKCLLTGLEKNKINKEPKPVDSKSNPSRFVERGLRRGYPERSLELQSA